MPISFPQKIVPLSKKEFHSLDYEITRHAFACHNDLGRFCDELVYQSDLAARLQEAGLGEVTMEMPILLEHETFAKKLYADLLVAHGALYEIKTASSLTGDHQKQLLNYLLLINLPHGKLLNFRTESLEHFFVSTSLNAREQRRFTIDTERWCSLDKRSEDFKNILLSLFSDWGVFLELSIYVEALTWFLGGAETIVRPLEIVRQGKLIATQRAHFLTSETAFRLTAFNRSPEVGERHLRRFLAHTNLKAIQWVNLNRHEIQFTTLLNNHPAPGKGRMI